MTSEQFPLGQKEGQRLEFKGRDILRRDRKNRNNREKIGREVVGMLNAVGGEIWIGVAEEGGIARRFEPIEDAETERRALRDYLVDSIEPPISSEVEVEIVTTTEGEEVLRLRARPDEARKPYALLRKTLRDFVIRVDERLRPMGRDEVLRPPKKTQDALQKAMDRVQKAREQVERFPNGTFWLHFEPVEKLSIEVQDPIFKDLVLDPALTDNRRTGSHFARASDGPDLVKEGVRWGGRDHKTGLVFQEVTVKRSGTLSFRVALDFFHLQREPNQLWPGMLVEYPTSAFRIARYIYRKWGASTRNVIECALLDIEGWGLRSGDPASFRFRYLRFYEEARDLVWEEPLVFTKDEILGEPDRCGFRLVRRIYEAFGHPEDSIPFFDRKSRRLVLPE